MNINDLTFFTNEPERNLYQRFNKILDKNTQFFDVLVGYFRASGFYLMQDAMKNVKKSRILIGINTDKKVVEMFEEAQGEIKEMSLSNMETIENYKKKLEDEFECSDDNKDVEEGVNKFIQLIKDNKLELRVYTKQPIHAKIYIMRDYEENPDFGRVITGSSNFSQSGLVNNLEFNVELKNSADVQFALDKFEELWKESVEVNTDCINTIEEKTWIKSDITPYEMYVKFLYEYFKEEINDDLTGISSDNKKYYPDGFRPLQYQKDAVIQAKRIIEKHNGVFISDVVGLGKTYICAMLAQELDGKKLILCPPVLVDYWEKVLFDFGVRGAKVESEGKLEKIIDDGTEQFSYVFIDESHRFRNANTEQYKLLHQICTGKKVILISATPQNNYSTDIENQMYLFQSRYKSTIVTARNLSNFFDSLRRKMKSVEKDTPEYKEILKEVSEEIRDKVLREVMIRRTRTEIEKVYAEDLKKQGLTFPKISDPIKLTYEFDEQTDKIFEDTIQSITELNYSRYKPLTYIKEEKLTSMQKMLLTGQRNMSGFMKGILVKRLESSKYAFEMTLNRFINSCSQFIDMYNSGTLWISKKLNVQELLDNNDIDKLLESEEKEEAFKIEVKDMDKSFIEDLQSDLYILNKLKMLWASVKEDDKLNYFIEEMKKRKELKNKLIIFTESKETAEYLQEKLENSLKENVLLFSGSMPDSIRTSIRSNFDPNYKIENQRNEYRILVTTDVLAEGMNLHRSNVIINYDLPWNPTRIMQRVGRINRVGTKHKDIYVFNFFPTSKSNEQMSLESNIINKMQMFHDILGEDSKFLTDDEEISTHELFRRINTIQIEDGEEINSELSYLKIIRDIRDKDNELFMKIQKYPKKIKIGRKEKDDKEELITFFRKGYLKRFYKSNGIDETDEITFEDAIERIKAEKIEKAIKVKDSYYELLKDNKEQFDIDEKEDRTNEITVINKKGSSNAKNIIKVLKECLKIETRFTDNEIQTINDIIDLLEEGELPTKIIKEGNKIIKSIKGINDFVTFFKDFEKTIPDVYFEKSEEKEELINKNKKREKEIILSEYFISE